MGGKIITVAQQKGGAGKTTLAAQLAVALASRGRRVALMDIDPQGSLAAWFRVRVESGRTGGISLSSLTGWRTQAAVDKLAAQNDFVLVDSPPHAETEAKIAVRAANLVLVPIQPSPMDLWATEPTLALARAEKRSVLLVINRAQTRVKLAEALSRQIMDLGAEVAKATIGNRAPFAASMLDGRGVVETAPRSKAAEEIGALAKEVTKWLSRG